MRGVGTAMREYARSSSAVRNDENIRRRFGNYSQQHAQKESYHDGVGWNQVGRIAVAKRGALAVR
jgi:hypothetical protein